jgi:hypothetical protein
MPPPNEIKIWVYMMVNVFVRVKDIANENKKTENKREIQSNYCPLLQF